MKALPSVLLLFASLTFAQTAPSQDVSGNSLLKGAYNFRQVSYYVSNALGTLSRSTALFGTITFDGAGNYTIAGSLLDSTAVPVAAVPYTKTGTYGIAASGFGSLVGPLSNTDSVHGLVSNGIFIGSSTNSSFNDLFVATPATPTATAATLKGVYSIASLEFPSTDPTAAISAWFPLNADGLGNLGAVTVTGHVAATAATLATQSIPSATYTFGGGVGTIVYQAFVQSQGAISTPLLVGGSKALYVSPDGKFVFGGSTSGWDLFIGVNVVSPAPSTLGFTGLYYQAGLDQDVSQLSSGTTTLAGYYGSLNTAKGQTIGHQHLNSLPVSSPYDYTFADTYTQNTDGSYSDVTLGATYILGTDGIRIGYDTGSALGINVALPAATLTGSGVFLNPQGVVNAASYAPFTAGISPGELISLFGSNLAATTTGSTEIPIIGELGNVQVMINGAAAPVTFVSPTMISAIVPYTVNSSTATSTLASFASIQVINNGTASNIVSMPLSITSPGVFTYPADGIGYAAVLHLDYSLVSTTNPAQTGETLAVFVEGLGAVTPAITAGGPGPFTPLSETPAGSIGMLIDGQLATVSYAGLAPGYPGLYQINVEVPAGTSSGDVYLSVAGPDSLTTEAKISIAPGAGTMTTNAHGAMAWQQSRLH